MNKSTIYTIESNKLENRYC
uniref:Uncharacterized protein n=1 Tax=Arundo donax TaxID=35708 RepID=A0A0A9DZT2_ARUDO